MASWKENKLVGIAAGVIFLAIIIFIVVQVNQNIQKKRKISDELKKWQSTSQYDKVPK